MLRVDHSGLSQLALDAPPGAEGLVLVPYLEGERTPNRPDATGALHGLTLGTSSPAHLARAAIEGLLCGLADGLDALERHGARINRIILVGGGARSEALRLIAPSILGHPVAVPSPGEYVANGAAIQAAWVISDAPHPPSWGTADEQLYEGDAIPAIRERYAAARDLTVPQRRTGRLRDDSER
jgi:xylulokinase